jgi:uncharacterized protein (DUF169 family)
MKPMDLLKRMKSLLRLEMDPVAVYMSDEDHGLKRLDVTVPATCSLWNIACKRGEGFYTLREDHNCSIGRVTHGYDTVHDVRENDDVRLLASMGWISIEDIERLPRLPSKRVIAYSSSDEREADIVVIICNAEQAMLIIDAAEKSGIPVNVRGKPTCACIADAYSNKGITIGLGCTVSRIRTPYDSSSLLVAVYGKHLSRLLDNLEYVARIDDALHCSKDLLLRV